MKTCDAPGPLRLWSFNLSRGIFLAALLFLLLHGGGLAQRLSGPIGAVLMVVATIAFALVMHVATIVQMRHRIRTAVEEASGGDLPPICLNCGHDCAAIESRRCPECGSWRRSSDRILEHAE